MLYCLPSPGVNHMNHTVCILNNRRVGIFIFIPFKRQHGFPLLTVRGDCNVQHVSVGRKWSPPNRVIVNQDLPTVLKCRRIGTGIRIGQEVGAGFDQV